LLFLSDTRSKIRAKPTSSTERLRENLAGFKRKHVQNLYQNRLDGPIICHVLAQNCRFLKMFLLEMGQVLPQPLHKKWFSNKPRSCADFLRRLQLPHRKPRNLQIFYEGCDFELPSSWTISVPQRGVVSFFFVFNDQARRTSNTAPPPPLADCTSPPSPATTVCASREALKVVQPLSPPSPAKPN